MIKKAAFTGLLTIVLITSLAAGSCARGVKVVTTAEKEKPVYGGTLVIEMDRAGFAIASGSACASGATDPSETLLAMGVSPDLARGAVRVSLGAESDDSHVADFVTALKAVLRRFSTMAAV